MTRPPCVEGRYANISPPFLLGVDSGRLRSATAYHVELRLTQKMDLQKAEQAMVNAIYAAVAWLLLDFGLLLQEHGKEAISILSSRPLMAAGALLTIVCIVGLFFKSRLAAIVLVLIFLLPLVLHMVQGASPSAMTLLFSLFLLYFFLAAVIGSFSYHQLEKSGRGLNSSD